VGCCLPGAGRRKSQNQRRESAVGITHRARHGYHRAVSATPGSLKRGAPNKEYWLYHGAIEVNDKPPWPKQDSPWDKLCEARFTSTRLIRMKTEWWFWYPLARTLPDSIRIRTPLNSIAAGNLFVSKA
jgi:hypothetical protein